MRNLAILFILAPSIAHAAACQGPAVSSGWGASFPQGKTVSGFTYDYVNELMYAQLPTINQYITYINIPYSPAYGFANTNKPDTYYAQQIKPIYKKALETDKCFALRTLDGKFLVVSGP